MDQVKTSTCHLKGHDTANSSSSHGISISKSTEEPAICFLQMPADSHPRRETKALREQTPPIDLLTFDESSHSCQPQEQVIATDHAMALDSIQSLAEHLAQLIQLASNVPPTITRLEETTERATQDMRLHARETIDREIARLREEGQRTDSPMWQERDFNRHLTSLIEALLPKHIDKDRIQDLTTAVHKLNAFKIKVGVDFENLRNDVKKQQQQAGTNAQQAQSQASQIKSLTAANAAHVTEIQHLRDAHTTQQKQIQDLMNANAAQMSQVHTLTKRLNAQESQIAHLQNKVGPASSSAQGASHSELQRIHNKINGLDQRLSTKVARLEDDVDGMTEDVVQHEKDIKELWQRIRPRGR